jgi:hypothetical protein
MTRRPSSFRQQDVTRAVKAVTAAGVDIARIEVDTATGRITITTGRAAEPGWGKIPNEWDAILHHGQN